MSMNDEFFLDAPTKDKILTICDGILEALTTIEEDFASQYFILIELTHRALTRITWYKDQLETFSGWSNETTSNESKKDIIKDVLEFPTWELISLLGAVVNEPCPTLKLCACAYKILTIVQNLFRCWQQLNDLNLALETCSRNGTCHSTGIHAFKTTLLTKGQFSVLFKLILPLCQNISTEVTSSKCLLCCSKHLSFGQPWTLLFRQLNFRASSYFKGTVFAMCMTKEDTQQMQLKVIQILTLLCSIATPVLNSSYSISSTQLDSFFLLLVEKCYSFNCKPILKIPCGFEIFLTFIIFQFSFPAVKNASKAALFQLLKCLTYQCFPLVLDDTSTSRYVLTLAIKQNRLCFGFVLGQLCQMISFLFHHTLFIETNTCSNDSLCSSLPDSLGICFDLVVFLLDFLKSTQLYDSFLFSLVRKELDFFLLNVVKLPLKEPYLLSLCLKLLFTYTNLMGSVNSFCPDQLPFLYIAPSHKEKTILSSVFTFHVNENSLYSFLSFLWTELISNYIASNNQNQLIQILLFSRFLLLTYSLQPSWKVEFLCAVIPLFRQLFHTCFSNDISVSFVSTLVLNNCDQTECIPEWWKHGILTSTLSHHSNKKTSLYNPNDMHQGELIKRDTTHTENKKAFDHLELKSTTEELKSADTFKTRHQPPIPSNQNEKNTVQLPDTLDEPLNTTPLNNFGTKNHLDNSTYNQPWNLHKKAFTEMVEKEKHFNLVDDQHNTTQIEMMKEILSKTKFFLNEEMTREKNLQCLQSHKEKNCLLFVLKLYIEMLAASLVDCIDSMYQMLKNSCFECTPSILGASKELSYLSFSINISQKNHIIYSPFIQPLTYNQSQLQNYVKSLWMQYLSSLSVLLSLDLSVLSLTMFCLIIEIFKGLIALLCIFSLPCGLQATLSFLSRYLCMAFDTLANDLTELSCEKNMDCRNCLKLYFTQLTKNTHDFTTSLALETCFPSKSWSHSFQCTLHCFHGFLQLVESFASYFQTSHWLLILKVFETFHDMFPHDFLFLDCNTKTNVMSNDLTCFQKSLQLLGDSTCLEFNQSQNHKISPLFISFHDLKWISSRLFNFFHNTEAFFQFSYGLKKVAKALAISILDFFSLLEQSNANEPDFPKQQGLIHQQNLVQSIMSFITNDTFLQLDFASMNMTSIIALKNQFIKKNHLIWHATYPTISSKDNFYLSSFYIYILNNISFFQHAQNGYIICHLLHELFHSSVFITQKNMLNAIDFLKTYAFHVINKIALPLSLVTSSNLPSLICFDHSIVSVILSTFIEIFRITPNNSLKYTILKNMYTLITSNGSRIESSVSWTLITLFTTVCMQESYDLNNEIWLLHLNMLTSNVTACSHTETYCLQNAFSFKSIGWCTLQHNDLFTFLEYLILQYRMKIYEPTALVLISLSLSTMASCHESGHNISFTSVGLLWTLAESLIRRYTLLKENTNAQPSFLPILPNHAYRALNFSLATQQFHIPLGLHSPLEEQEQLSRTVIIIFHLFKYHALDSRIEVRNCALKSLLVAYEEILQKSSNHHAIFKHCVSQIILHVLKDCVSTYKLLMEHEPFFEKQMPANDGSLHHHSRDSQIKLWNETFTILFDAVTRLIHYCISCVSSETFFDESHKFLKNTCDTAIKFPKYILLNCAENPSTSPQVIAACLSFVVVVITKSIECNFLSFSLLEPYWVLFEKFITALWSFSVIPNQIVDHLIGAVTKLCLNVLPFFFKKNVERCTRLLAACVSSIHYAVHIAQMPELNFSKDHPYRSEQHVESIFPSLKLCEKIILSGAFFFNKYDTYFFKHILTVMKSDQLLEFLRTTFSYPDDVKTGDSLDKCFKNSCFFNQNIFKNLVFQSNDFNPSTLPDPPIRTNYSYSSIPADFCTPIRKTELSESPFEEKISIQSMHGNEETLEGNNTENVMPLEFFSTCTSLKLKHESLDDETYNYTLEYKKLCRNDQNNPFDDDYVSLPSWLIPELCISLKDHPELSKQFCQIIKIKRRLRVARKKILTIDSYFELLEGHFPWEQLLILSPYLWLTVLKKSFSYFFSCERLLGNPNFLVKTFRFINSVTRIQRRCYFHISTLKTNSDDVFFGLVILTYKLCTQLISLIIFLRGFHALSHQSYVYEAVIQTFLDLKVFLDYVFQDTRNFPSNLLDLLEVLSIPLMALLDTWLSFQKIISPSSSSPQNFLNNNISDLFPFLAKILLIKQGRPCNAMIPSKLNNLLAFSLICFLENISVSKYSPYNQNVPVLGLAVLFHIAKAYGNHGMLPLNASLEKDSTNQHVDNYTLVQRQYYIIIVCLINRIRTLFDDYVKEENDSGQCPVPRYRLEQVCLALVKIRELDPLLHTINVFKLKDNERTLALTHFFFVKSLGSSVPQPFKQTFVLELFPDLIPLISSKDKAVRHHVIQLMQCLVPHFLKFPTD